MSCRNLTNWLMMRVFRNVDKYPPFLAHLPCVHTALTNFLSVYKKLTNISGMHRIERRCSHHMETLSLMLLTTLYLWVADSDTIQCSAHTPLVGLPIIKIWPQIYRLFCGLQRSSSNLVCLVHRCSCRNGYDMLGGHRRHRYGAETSWVQKGQSSLHTQNPHQHDGRAHQHQTQTQGRTCWNVFHWSWEKGMWEYKFSSTEDFQIT